MRSFARLLLVLLFASGSFLPAGGSALAAGGSPCPSREFVLECIPADGHHAIARALAGLDKPCHGQAIEVARHEIARPGEAVRAAFVREDHGGRGLPATGIDPPPRIL